MQYVTTYPIATPGHGDDFYGKTPLVRFATTAERLGLDGMGFTDHPAPTHRWLQSGGHDAYDPFTAFGVVAAVTERLRLIPNILVLPYRNPFIVAKAAATLDCLSDGRFVLAVATGYLRGEYRALGVDFEERNELFDEALEVIRGVWSTDDYAYEGRHFKAPGQTTNPRPGHVPVWIGGNSTLSRRRVATSADGWSPFPAQATLAKTAKTPVLDTVDDLVPMVQDLRRRLEDAGRDPSSIDICIGALGCRPPGVDGFNPQQHLDTIGELKELGVTWIQAGFPGDCIDHALEAMEEYASAVIDVERRS